MQGEKRPNVFILKSRANYDLAAAKTIIVGDAFDPLNRRSIETIYKKPQFSNLLNPLNPISPRALGYDMVFIDFSQGGGDIIKNAGINLKVIEYFSKQTQSGVIVGGPSMSGLVARTALLMGLPNNNATGTDLCSNVKGYLSIDTPHKGASIAPSLQRAIFNMHDKGILDFIIKLFGQPDVPLSAWSQLSVAGTMQMLYGRFCLPLDYEDKLKDYNKDMSSYSALYLSQKQLCETQYNLCYSLCGDNLACKTNCETSKNTCLLTASTTYNTLVLTRNNDWSDYKSSQSYITTKGHEYFYEYLRALGDIRKDIVSVAIAYSDFYFPYGRLYNNATKRQVGKINPPIGGEFKFTAGGTNTDPESHEFAPGAMGDWYFAYWLDGQKQTPSAGEYFELQPFGNNELYKGTFIPIYSALGLRNGFNISISANQSQNILLENSMFNHIITMRNKPNVPNWYGQTIHTVNNNRFQHIVFDDELMGHIQEALFYIEENAFVRKANSIRLAKSF